LGGRGVNHQQASINFLRPLLHIETLIDVLFFFFFLFDASVQVHSREYKPIYKPKVRDLFDTSNFDPEYTGMPVMDSVIPDSTLKDMGEANFEGFTYVKKGKLHNDDD
jgi:hypothetical protein